MRGFQKIALLWFVWAVALLGFQSFVQARYQPARPDFVLQWTPSETTGTSQNDQPYLIEPFMNAQVSWDSEFYLSIATHGYDDPLVRVARTADGSFASLNYAFMPFYPLMIRALSFPLQLIGLTPIATATLAGVIISLLGALAAMLSLYDLCAETLGKSVGTRAAFYLIIFPTGFFLAQVYTEGLFVGLAFASLALLGRKKWFWAAVLAALATWTRAVGIALTLALAWAWLQEYDWRNLKFSPFPRKTFLHGLLCAIPVAAFLVWYSSPLGHYFRLVEASFFGRGAFLVGASIYTWAGAFLKLFGNNPQTQVYYLVEFGAIILGLFACLYTLRKFPSLSLFSLAVIIISLTSGAAQGMHRYVLAAPSIFIMLAQWGEHEVFDRSWALISTLLMAVLATLFTFDMWVG